jgi:hypothetical protein
LPKEEHTKKRLLVTISADETCLCTIITKETNTIRVNIFTEIITEATNMRIMIRNLITSTISIILTKNTIIINTIGMGM